MIPTIIITTAIYSNYSNYTDLYSRCLVAGCLAAISLDIFTSMVGINQDFSGCTFLTSPERFRECTGSPLLNRFSNNMVF